MISWRAKVEDLHKSASACSISQIAAKMEPRVALRTRWVTICQPTIIIIGKMMQSARFALKRCLQQDVNLAYLTNVITFSAWSVFDHGVQPTISALPSTISARAPSVVRPAILLFLPTFMQQGLTKNTFVRSTSKHWQKYLAVCLIKARVSVRSKIAASMLILISKETNLNMVMPKIKLSILRDSGSMIMSLH